MFCSLKFNVTHVTERYHMILTIIGSRSFQNMALMTTKLDTILENTAKDEITIISGGAKGADTLAIQYAKLRNIKYKEYQADWSNLFVPNARIKTGMYGKYNANAGFDRNDLMAYQASHCVAFWDGKSNGTQHMIKSCNNKGVITRIINY